MAAHVLPFHPHTVDLAEGPVRLKLARMSPTQFAAFQARFLAIGKGRGNPATKTPSDDESPEDAALAVAAEMAYHEANAAWTNETLSTYVQVVEGDLVVHGEGEPDEVVTDGARFAELYAAEGALVFAELWAVNALTDRQKKTLAQLRASAIGSTTASSQVELGPRPETTATSAEPAASVPPAAVTALSNGASSGVTARSASKRARSARSHRRRTTSSNSSSGATRAGSQPWPRPAGSASAGRPARASTTRTRG